MNPRGVRDHLLTPEGGTLGGRTYDESRLASAWDPIAHRMEVREEYYEFDVDAAESARLGQDVDIVDIGCGTGRLLSLLSFRGWHDLSGVDFSTRAVDIARDHVPHADLYVHDIVEAPLPRQYGGVFFTGTLEHVSAPNQALSNIYESLRPGGFLFLSFPNRLAWWPWYYLRGVSHLVGRWPRLAHWVAWFTRPYEMRSDQPLDHAYSRNQVRRLILSSGFVILKEAGRGLLPMCRITGVGRTEEFVSIVEGWAHEFLRAQIMYYHYLFVCQKPTRTTRARGTQEEVPTLQP